MSKIFLDPGHGGHDSGALGFGLEEKRVNLSVSLKVKKILESHNINVEMIRKTDTFFSLSERAKRANKSGADYFISIHCNASNGKGYGAETYCLTGSQGAGKSLATKIQKSIVSAGLARKDRGVKEANFTILRETTMPAALVELAFIDNKEDNEILKHKENELALAVAKGILDELDIKYNPPSDNSSIIAPDGQFYKVSVGAFGSYSTAIKIRDKAIESGFKDSYLSKTIINGKTLFRVLLGAFKNYDNALDTLNKAKSKGFKDTYIYLE